MSDAPASEDDEPKKKKKPLLLIIVGLNLVLGLGAGAFFFLRGSGDAAASSGGGDHGGGHGKAEADDHGGGHGGGGHGGAAPSGGPNVEFMPIVVNLNEPEGSRYLKIGITVQVANSGQVQTIEDSRAVIIDNFIRELSDLNFRQTMGNKNKLVIKRRLIKRLNEAVGSDVAVDIHITQFIVQ